jgi:hypothetical protein
MRRFDPEFKPDMEYLQGILRKVPIHLLPNWYAIPRTSNNIFESIVEKYLATPQLFSRYLADLSFPHPLATQIMHDVLKGPDFRVSTSDLIAKYNLKREELEEILLLLEFSFVCCTTYSRGEGLWLEWVTPFHEWHEYLRFLQGTETTTLPSDKVLRKAQGNFAFLEELTDHLASCKPHPKLLLLQLQDASSSITEMGEEFLAMSMENRAAFLHRHPLNRPVDERSLREAEKSIKRVVKKGWVLFDEFIRGTTISLHDEGAVLLKKVGKGWKYTLPSYSESDRELIEHVVLQWLFELGIVAVGTFEGQKCFSVTPFGALFFEG